MLYIYQLLIIGIAFTLFIQNNVIAMEEKEIKTRKICVVFDDNVSPLFSNLDQAIEWLKGTGPLNPEQTERWFERYGPFTLGNVDLFTNNTSLTTQEDKDYVMQ